MSFETECKVPGLQPSSDEDGNLGDISKAGSFHEFLVNLHKKFGPIASFWWGKKYTVSIASAELFEEINDVFDRPPETYTHFSPVMEPKCIQFANGEEGLRRREHYMQSLTEDEIKKVLPKIQQVADQLVKQWSELQSPIDISLNTQASLFALKAIIHSLFADLIKDDSKEELDFRTEADKVWNEIEIGLVKPRTKEREEHLQEGRKDLGAFVKHLIDDRKANAPSSEPEMTFLDRILSYTDDKDIQHADVLEFVTAGQYTLEYCRKLLSDLIKHLIDDRQAKPPRSQTEMTFLDRILSYTDDTQLQHADSLQFSTAGQYVFENMLIRALYNVATHDEIQQKLYDEINAVLGEMNVDGSNMEKLVFLRQVIDETLRCSFVAGWAARMPENEVMLGGYCIPSKTPVIQALGVSLTNETIWNNPSVFNPERFSQENQQKRSKFWFSPFGAGKRECLMKFFPYAAASVFIVTILKKFKVYHDAKDQPLSPVYGLVTHQDEEICVSLTAR